MVRFAEVIWMFPQYTPGDPHGDVVVEDSVVPVLVDVADVVALTVAEFVVATEVVVVLKELAVDAEVETP